MIDPYLPKSGRRNPYFEALLKEGMNTSPIGAHSQGLSRLAFALLAGLERNDLERKERGAASSPDSRTGISPHRPSGSLSTPQASYASSANQNEQGWLDWLQRQPTLMNELEEMGRRVQQPPGLTQQPAALDLRHDRWRRRQEEFDEEYPGRPLRRR
jgi:hypothetical protein